jgi:hypothetical protein
VELGATEFTTTQQFDKAGIVLQENTAEEILDVSLEMLEALLYSYQKTSLNHVLQSQLRSVMGVPGEPFCGLVGSQFLDENPSWSS